MQVKWTEMAGEKPCQNEIYMFWIVGHLCVKEQDNDVSSVLRRSCVLFLSYIPYSNSMTDTSYYNTKTSLCSNSSTMVLKTAHYMNVVISRYMSM